MTDNFTPAADYRLVIDGMEITPTIDGRLTNLTLTDNRGLEADTLAFTLSDHDGALELPETGVEIQLFLGWQGQPLVDKGTYIVDEVEHSGTPDQLSLNARSANMRASLPGTKSRSWHNTTIGELVSTIAAEHDLEPKVAEHLAGIRIAHLDQTEESDLNLLTRLASRHDAIATIKSGRLLFIPTGHAETASGKPIPPVTLRRKDGDSHRYLVADRDTYTGVKAWWNNMSGGKRQAVVVGDAEKLKELRNTYASEDEAWAAAHSELNRLRRGLASLSLTLYRGRPALIAETPLILQGWKTKMDKKEWIITRVTHTLSESGGLMTAIEAEVRQDAED